MWKLLLQIVAGILGIFLAQKFVPGVSLGIIPGETWLFGIQFTAFWQILILVGGVLGLVNIFLKPILKAITLPLRLLTFGLFSLVINMLLVWIVDIIFPELVISGIIPLFWTSLIVWGLSFFLPKWMPEKKTPEIK
jgi:putative membrane protein